MTRRRSRPCPKASPSDEVVKECRCRSRLAEPEAGATFASLRSLVTRSRFAAAWARLRLRFQECRLLVWRAGAVRSDYRAARPCRHREGDPAPRRLAEVGQGSHTAARQMAAAAVGVAMEQVELDMSDTATSGNSGSVSASRMTFMAGNSIREAAALALAAWAGEERPAIGHAQYRPPRTTGLDEETGLGLNPNFSYGYMAQIVDIVVDIDTGHIHIERVVSTHDVGQAINRGLIEGQIEGAVVQATGYALMENLQVKDGRILNPLLQPIPHPRHSRHPHGR